VHLTILSLQECPLVPLLFVSISNSSCSATELYPRYILKTSIISCLFRHSSNVHNPNNFNRPSYVFSRIFIIILVNLCCILFSERERSSRSLYAIARLSVVCLSSVTFVRPTQAAEIFCNIFTALGTLAIR